MRCEIDPRRVLRVVLSYGGERDRVLRHLPVWKFTSDTIIFVSPEDEPLNIPGYREVLLGKSSHHGPDNNRRLTEAFRIGAGWHGDYVFIDEGDSLCVALLKRMLPPPRGVSACKRVNHKGSKFKSPWYLWFPQLWTVDGIRDAAHIMRHTDPAIERGYADRFTGYAAWKAKIPVNDLKASGDFFGAHTIVDEELFRGVLRLGPTWIHGIKDGPFFRHLMTTYDLNARKNSVEFTSNLI